MLQEPQLITILERLSNNANVASACRGICRPSSFYRLTTRPVCWPPIDDEPGFLVTPPRQDSQLAEHGVQGGDRLLSVDGRAVSTFRDVQAAIRRHALGHQVALRLRRGPYEEYEVRVRHVYDYEPAPG